MYTIQAIFVLALLTVAHSHSHDYCRTAYNECDWEFSGYNRGKIPTFSVHTNPDRAFTPAIVSKDRKEKLGTLNSNNVVPEFIFSNYPNAVPITKFGFTPTHFKPFTIPYTMTSGVGHQTFQGNQKQLAKGKCVRVFFTTYQTLSQGYPMVVEGNINVGKYDYKCVVFRLH